MFAGAKTACFSTTGNFNGCPAGAAHVSTSNFARVAAEATATNSARRLLLRRGETFAAADMVSIAIPGPGLVGSFGTGARPVIRAGANLSGDNVISFSSPGTPTMKDWRLMDVTMDGSSNPNTAVSGIGARGGIDQLTILRVNPKALRLGITLSDSLLDHWNAHGGTGHHVWDQLSVVDMDVTDMPGTVAAYGSYLAGERVFYAGNSVDGNGSTSHNARFTYLGKAVISNNSLRRPGVTEHSIKLHAPAWGDTGVEGSGVGGGYSRWVVISDNLFTSSVNAWQVAVGSQNAGSDERVKDVILERNLHRSGAGTQVQRERLAKPH